MADRIFIAQVLILLNVLALFSGIAGEELSIRLPRPAPSVDGQCLFPDILKLELFHGDQGREWSVQLKRSRVVPSVRSVSFMTGINGAEDVQINDHGDGIHGYHNQHQGAAFIVKCIQDGVHKPYFVLEGSVYVGQKKYRISPRPTRHHDVITSHHVITIYSMEEVNEFKVRDTNEKYLDNNMTQVKGVVTRRRRDTTPQMLYSIDIVPVIDSTLYSKFYNEAARNTSLTAKNIADYISVLFTGVNMRLDTLSLQGLLLQIKMIKPLLLTTPELSPYYGAKLDNTSGVPSINATTLLDLFKNWLVKNTTTVGAYDHAMFFTALKITGGGDADIKFNITSGLAYLRTLCKTNGESSSVIGDRGAYQSEGVVAHELAHCFGSLHDGQNNSCNSRDRFIMADTNYVSNDNNILNPWKFSSCSSDNILALLRELENDSTKRQKCLVESIGSNMTEYQTVSADEQCKRFYGNQSFICRGVNIPSLDTLCDEFYCRLPGTERCERMTAATGTCCGNQKKCLRGSCVSAAQGECPMDEICPLGDQTGVVLNNKTCAQLDSQYCYSEDISLRCCRTCRNYLSNRTGCQYGDKQTGCKRSDCGSIFNAGDYKDLSYDFICCATCNKSCIDKDFITINNQSFTCSDYILDKGNKNVCYRQDIHIESCCKSCEDARDSITDCPWGDRLNCSGFLKAPLGFTCNATQSVQCCKTCALLETRKSATTTKAATITKTAAETTTLVTAGNTVGVPGSTTTCDLTKRTSCRGSNIVFDFKLLIILFIISFCFTKSPPSIMCVSHGG